MPSRIERILLIERNRNNPWPGRKKIVGTMGLLLAIGHRRMESPWTWRKEAVKDETRTFIGNFTWVETMTGTSRMHPSGTRSPRALSIVQRWRKKEGAADVPPFLPPHCHCFLKGSDVKPCGERVVKSEIPLAYHRGEKGNLTN